MNSAPKVHKIAFVGDHLSRKCGIATFKSDLLSAGASAHPQSECLAVSEHAQPAIDWFIGWNDPGLELYSPETGGCRDGLHVDRVNANEGAESTLAFLLSLAEMQLAQNILTSFREPIVITE